MRAQRVVMRKGSMVLGLIITLVGSGGLAVAQPDTAPMVKSTTKAAATSSVLDGKTFVGELGRKGQKASDKDTLIFHAGKFHSTACDSYGFGDGAYTATVSGDTTTFEAQTVSAKEGTIQWKGTVKGSSLEGTFVWSRSGKAPKEYWIKCQLKT